MEPAVGVETGGTWRPPYSTAVWDTASHWFFGGVSFLSYIKTSNFCLTKDTTHEEKVGLTG